MALEKPLLENEDPPPVAVQQTPPFDAATQYVQPAASRNPPQGGYYYQAPAPSQLAPNPQSYYQIPQGNAALNPVQYMYVPVSNYQTPAVVVGAPPSNYKAPHDFLVLAIITTFVCGFLVIVSLAFGVSAVILAILSYNAKNSKNYPKAKDYGKYSLLLTIINIVFTMLVLLLVIGLTMGFSYTYYYPYYY